MSKKLNKDDLSLAGVKSKNTTMKTPLLSNTKYGESNKRHVLRGIPSEDLHGKWVYSKLTMKEKQFALDGIDKNSNFYSSFLS